MNNQAFVKYVKERTEKEAWEKVPESEEQKKYLEYKDHLGKVVYYLC